MSQSTVPGPGTDARAAGAARPESPGGGGEDALLRLGKHLRRGEV